MGREDEIRLIAYNLWEEEGCLGGRDCEHWYRAEVIWEEQNQPPVLKRSPRRSAKTAQPKPAAPNRAAPKKSPKKT